MIENLMGNITAAVVAVRAAALAVSAVLFVLGARKARRAAAEAEREQARRVAALGEEMTRRLEDFATGILSDTLYQHSLQLVRKGLEPAVADNASRLEALSGEIRAAVKQGVEQMGEAMRGELSDSLRAFSHQLEQAGASLQTASQALEGRAAEQSERFLAAAEGERAQIQRLLAGMEESSRRADGLAQALAAAQEGLAGFRTYVEELQGQTGAQAETAAALTQAAVLAQERAAQAYERLEQCTDRFGTQFADAAEAMRASSEHAASRTVEGLRASLEQAVRDSFANMERVSGQHAERISGLSAALQEAAVQLDAHAGALSETASATGEVMAAAGRALADDMSFRLDAVSNVISGSVEGGYERLTQGAQAYEQTFSESLLSLRSQLDEQLRSISISTAALTSQAEALQGASASLGEQFARHVDASLEKAFASFDESIAAILERVAAAAHDLSAATGRNAH